MRDHGKAVCAAVAILLALVAVTPRAIAEEPVAVEQEPSVEPIDVNRASAADLERVPGIGPATAQRIIEWREQHGPFERLEDLLNVRGIGEKTLEKLRPYLTVGKVERAGSGS